MRKKLLIIPAALCLLVIIIFACKKDSKCKNDCENGGTCVSNACSCPDDYSGTTCETFYTENYAGDYSFSSLSCGAAIFSETITVSVDPNDKTKLILGDMYAIMTDRTHFTIPAQGSSSSSGSGSIDGKIMSIKYSVSASGTSMTCSGTGKRK